MDQLLTPRGLVLTLASFFWERGGGWTRFDSGREVAVVGGCFCLGRCVCTICFVVFFVWGLLDTCPFLGALWIAGVRCGLIVGPETLGYLNRAALGQCST